MSRCLLVLAAGCVLLAALVASGCYRTTYVGLKPPARDTPEFWQVPQQRTSWQHFFIWGWVPDLRVIHAERICEGAEKVESIRTRRRFVQGLVAAFAGYYINIYSPYNGSVFCRRPVHRINVGSP